MNDDLSIPDFLNRKIHPYKPATYVPICEKEIPKSDNNVNYIRYNSTTSANILIKNKITSIISLIEGMFDDNEINLDWSLYNFLLSHDASVNVATAIIDTFYPRAEELVEVLCTLDDDLRYAYRAYTQNEIHEKAKIYTKLIKEAELYIENKRRKRKVVRKRRARSEKIIKNLQYAKEYEKYKIVSIDPNKIIGASELWTFNFKNSVLTVYRAAKNRMLTLQRSNVINYDNEVSKGKRIGRKTDIIIQNVIEQNKRDISKMFDEIKSDQLEPTRITKNTILLRVFK